MKNDLLTADSRKLNRIIFILSIIGIILGIPVPAFGLIGYTLLAILTFLRTTSRYIRLSQWMVGIATFGIVFVSWFTYTEIFIIKAVCTWCAVSTVNMFAIFYLSLKSYNIENYATHG